MSDMQRATGQVVKVQTTADECIRVTVDIDSEAIPESVNVLSWKNRMVVVAVVPDDNMAMD